MPVFPPGQFPVKLPAVSLLGARNDLPNPFRAGVHWGQLPDGRKWGSTAGVSAAPEGRTIWAIDRCGASGAGGTACADSPFDPVLQFDPAGKLLKSLAGGGDSVSVDLTVTQGAVSLSGFIPLGNLPPI